jgi:hypothetical protein
MKTLGDYVFQFKTTGILQFDPGKGTKHFDPNWCIVKLDEDIANYYRWHLLKRGVATDRPNRLWKFHISCIKGEELTQNQDKWGEEDGASVEIYYGNWISYSNGRHSWIDCYSDDLHDLRRKYGLDINDRKLKYHATLGRLKRPWEPDVKRPGYIYKHPSGIHTL